MAERPEGGTAARPLSRLGSVSGLALCAAKRAAGPLQSPLTLRRRANIVDESMQYLIND
ncbi:MAG: hypothetical protein WB760_17690 [Xanthobacteraceae bacterium]